MFARATKAMREPASAAQQNGQQRQEPLQRVFVKVRGLFPQAYQVVLDLQNKDLPDGGSDKLLP